MTSFDAAGSAGDDDAPRLLVAGALAVREDGSEARLGGRDLPLTTGQRRILAALLRRRGRVGARAELYEEAFGRSLATGSRAVDLHVQRIRRALGPQRSILTVGRVGYRLDWDALTGRGYVPFIARSPDTKR